MEDKEQKTETNSTNEGLRIDNSTANTNNNDIRDNNTANIIISSFFATTYSERSAQPDFQSKQSRSS